MRIPRSEAERPASRVRSSRLTIYSHMKLFLAGATHAGHIRVRKQIRVREQIRVTLKAPLKAVTLLYLLLIRGI
jgi:hypothetical protein